MLNETADGVERVLFALLSVILRSRMVADSSAHLLSPEATRCTADGPFVPVAPSSRNCWKRISPNSHLIHSAEFKDEMVMVICYLLGSIGSVGSIWSTAIYKKAATRRTAARRNKDAR